MIIEHQQPLTCNSIKLTTCLLAFLVPLLLCHAAPDRPVKSNPAETLKLLPPPQEIKLTGNNSFNVTSKTPISGKAEHTTIVRDVLAERLNLTDLLKGSGGITVNKPINSSDELWKHDQAYQLTVKKSGILIEAKDNRSIFYAAQTLAQLIQHNPKIPAMVIRDWPAIPTRLVMIATDQGGFQVIDIEYWKRIIRELASCKMNAVMPYFDCGTYKYKKYPFLGSKGDDGFTMEKAKILSKYADAHFVQLIPQQNSLGHLGGLLAHKELRHLRDGGGTINMVSPETTEFLGDLYDELVEAFPNSPAIHVGGDEFSSGFGKNPIVAARIKEIGQEGVYGEFMTKLRDMLKARNRKMMIWWNERGLTIKAGPRMPKEIGVFDWHYGPQKDYPSLDKLLKAGFTAPWATPAVTRYYSRGNSWEGTFGNIHNFAVAGAKRNVPGICTCTWVHGMWGGRNMFELNLYGLVYSAECGWNPSEEIEAASFAERYASHWLGCNADQAAKWVIEGIHTPYGKTKEEQKFWYDNRALEPLASSSLSTIMEQLDDTPTLETDAKSLLALCSKADTALNSLKKCATRNQRTLDYYKHDVRIHRLAANRILAAAEMKRWTSGLKLPKAVPEKELANIKFEDADEENAAIKIDTSSKKTNGVLITSPGDKWKRGGVTIGPMPMPENGALVEYDIKPLQYGQQFQQLASMKPVTHHYMAFIGPDRKFHLYTRSGGNWSPQGTISTPCSLGKWYSCSAVIRKNTLSFKVKERETGKTVCRSGIVPMDDIGSELMFNLSDSHGDEGNNEPATEWDNIRVSSLTKVTQKRITAPKRLIDLLTGLVDQHKVIEQTFNKSILEAGGGSADTGNIGKGNMRFRSNLGRKDIELMIDNLKTGRLPASFYD